MDLTHLSIQPAEPLRHFAAIAALLSGQETEPTTEQSLFEWYNRQLEDGIQFMVAVSQADTVLGFNGIYRENLNYGQLYEIYLIVEQGSRGSGLGSLSYNNLIGQALKLGARTLKARVRDNDNVSIRFADQRGFVEKKHSIEMMFNLRTWDDTCYEPTLHALQQQGFRFINMAELGDTLEARRKLYTLNSTAAATDPGSDGVQPWASFEDFNKFVCNTSWYHPDGQIVAIDMHTGEWAAMSAITVFAGADHAYNLFTGTDVRYRGRKLAQAVKALALHKERTFGVDTVRTSHNSENAAMIAIDTKLGYVRTPGMLIMEKEMENA